MILDLTSEAPKTTPAKKKNWKEDFKVQLYSKNQEVILHAKNLRKKRQEAGFKNAIEAAGKKCFDTLERETSIPVKDTTTLMGCHSYYSSFIPIKDEAKFDDELMCTFPYLKHLEEKGRTNEKQRILHEISEHMHVMKERKETMGGWKKCLQSFICGIDVIKAIEIYLEIKKRGTSVLDQLQARFSNKCRKEIFFYRVCMAARYFGAHKQENLRIMPLSMEPTDQINEATMSKTMKMLFCNICLLYDCGKHTLDQNFKEKQYQYVSPKNILDDESKILSAIALCQAHKDLFIDYKIQGGKNCSQKCYKNLTPEKWKENQKQRALLLAPFVQGIIKMGIQMNGYDPCYIWNLLIDVIPKKGVVVTCSLVFLFFIEEYNLYSRLQKKLTRNEAEMLRRQMQGEVRLPEPPKKTTKKKVQVKQKENNEHFSTCGHYFVGELPNDENCTACLCQERGYCLTQCLCSPSCPLRRKGCNCKKQDCRTKKCSCFLQSRECEPEICSSCFSDRSKCRNNAILLKKFKKVRVGRSGVSGAGLGLFAAEKIEKEDLVMIYAGEIIDPNIDALRENMRSDLSFYNFSSKDGIVDARFKGNLSRFINHGDCGDDNLRSEDMMSEGRYKIGFYASRLIEVGEELFFNYDGQGLLYQNFKEKYPFIRSSRRQSNKMRN